MSSQSLKYRMMFAGAMWILFALLTAGAAISYMFIENVEKGARSDLSATMSRLIAIIDLDVLQDRPRLARHLPDPRYQTPFSGVYWQITDLDSMKVLRSRSLWDKNILTGKVEDGEHFASISGPSGQSLLALSLMTSFKSKDSERHYEIVVAQDRSILDETIRHFAWEMAAALIVLGASLVFAGLLQVRYGLLPFRQLKKEVEDIRKGTSASLESVYPLEVYPLVAEVNELLKLQEKSIDFARARASDLAHGLKTPLSVLATLAYELEGRGETATASQLIELSEEMNSRVDYQLRLSKLRHRGKLHTLSAPLESIVQRTIAVLKKTREGEQLQWQIEMAQQINVDIDPNDLIELTGVLLENAAKWAKSTVRVAASSHDFGVELRIHDDGPGLYQPEIEMLGVRGQRFDESVSGSGLGLAIAKEILAMNNGLIMFESTPETGTLVIIRLPIPIS